MKTRLDWRIGAAALLLAAAASAGAQSYGPGGMMGNSPGMMMGGGPGMMGGAGMGPGMMWGNLDQAYAGLDLSADQRKKIADIQEQSSKSMWQLMGTLHEQGYRMGHMMGASPVDDADARKAYDAMAATHKAMFESQLDARKRIDAVLTPAQREQLRKYWGGR
jgi:Spy/CpxP family protein refolding chaperone